MTFPSLSFFISKMGLIHPRPQGFCERFKKVACTYYLVEHLKSASSSVNVVAPNPNSQSKPQPLASASSFKSSHCP